MRLGIDLGTSSVKVLAFDRNQEALVASAPYPVSSPRPLWAETDAELWIGALRSALAELSSKLGAAGFSRLESIGFSGQMHGFVPVSLQRGALCPAILWADQRSERYVASFATLSPETAAACLNPAVPGMAALSLPWLRDERPDIYADTDVILFPKDYLRWRLTGELSTERTDASASLLYDFKAEAWHLGLAAELGIDAAKLPAIRASLGLAGAISDEGAALTGLPAETPVGRGAADAAAAIFGSALHDERTIQISAGSGLQIVRLARSLPARSASLNVFAAVEKGTWYRMAAMLNGGIALEWARSILGLSWEEAYAAFDSGIPAPPRDLFFLPYLIGERSPYMDSAARGAWIGLGLHHGRLDLLHAALLGVALSLRLGLETLGSEEVREFRLIGGSARFPYWNRLIATALGKTLAVSNLRDLSAWGAALIGAHAAGLAPLEMAEDRPTRVEPGRIEGLEEYYAAWKDSYQLTRQHNMRYSSLMKVPGDSGLRNEPYSI